MLARHINVSPHNLRKHSLNFSHQVTHVVVIATRPRHYKRSGLNLHSLKTWTTNLVNNKLHYQDTMYKNITFHSQRYANNYFNITLPNYQLNFY